MANINILRVRTVIRRHYINDQDISPTLIDRRQIDGFSGRIRRAWHHLTFDSLSLQRERKAMLQITHHAQTRLQQRGIPAHIVEILLEFGHCVHDHRGGTILYCNHESRHRLRQQIPSESYKQIESHLGTYAIVSSNGVIVTVGHRTQRIQRH